MDIAGGNVEKRRLSGALLKSMANHSTFGKTIQDFTSKIDTFLQLSYSADISPELAAQVEICKRVVSSQIPCTQINSIIFKCEDIKTLIQQVRRNIAALPLGKHKDMLLGVFEEIQDSLHTIQEEGQKDTILQNSFRQTLLPPEKISLLIDAHDVVISQTTAKIIFRSIVDEAESDVIGRLLHIFFHNESVHQLLSDTKMILFFVSTISGQNTKSKEWKKQALAIFLQIPQVIEAVLQSQDPDLEQKLRANIENKTLDMFYKTHRRKRAA